MSGNPDNVGNARRPLRRNRGQPQNQAQPNPLPPPQEGVEARPNDAIRIRPQRLIPDDNAPLHRQDGAIQNRPIIGSIHQQLNVHVGRSSTGQIHRANLQSMNVHVHIYNGFVPDEFNPPDNQVDVVPTRPNRRANGGQVQNPPEPRRPGHAPDPVPMGHRRGRRRQFGAQAGDARRRQDRPPRLEPGLPANAQRRRGDFANFRGQHRRGRGAMGGRGGRGGRANGALARGRVPRPPPRNMMPRRHLAAADDRQAQHMVTIRNVRFYAGLELAYKILGKDAQAMIQTALASQRQLSIDKALVQEELAEVKKQTNESEAARARQMQHQDNLLEAGRLEIARLRQQADEQYESLVRAQKDNEALQSDMHQLHQEAHARIQEIEQAHEMAMDDLTREHQNYLDEQLEEMESEKQKVIREFEEALLQSEQAHKMLEEQLAKAQSDLQESLARHQETDDEIERQNTVRESLEQQLEQSRSDAKETEAAKQELARQLQEAQSNLTQAQESGTRDLLKLKEEHTRAQEDALQQNHKMAQQLKSCQEDLKRHEQENLGQKLKEALDKHASQEHQVAILTRQLNESSSELTKVKEHSTFECQSLQTALQEAEDKYETVQNKMQLLERDLQRQDQQMVSIFKMLVGVHVDVDALKQVLTMLVDPCEDATLSNVTSTFWTMLPPLSSRYQRALETFKSNQKRILQLLGMVYIDATKDTWLPTVLTLLGGSSRGIETSEFKQLGPIMRFLIDFLWEKDIGDEKGNFLLKFTCREALCKFHERFGNVFQQDQARFNNVSAKLQNSELWFLEDAVMDGAHRRGDAVAVHLRQSCGASFHSLTRYADHEIGILALSNSGYFLVLDLKLHSVLWVSKRLARVDAAQWPREDLIIANPHENDQIRIRFTNTPSSTAVWWQLCVMSF